MTEPSTHIPFKGHGTGCPLCGSVSGVRVVGTECWSYCETHLTTWWIGSRAPGFSASQTENNLLASIRFLSDYRVLDSDIHAAGAEPEDLP